MYGSIHKGLRKAQLEMLLRLGSAEFSHAGTVDSIIADMRTILTMAASHLLHENEHVHRALENKAPGSSSRLEDQHGSHQRDFAQLEELLQVMESSADATQRKALGRRLYLGFGAFIAHDLEHMHEEVTIANPLLQSLFTDAELEEIEMGIISTLTPEKTIAFMRLMIPASNPEERASMLGGMKANAPPEAFQAVIDLAARPTLSEAEFADLSRRLGL
jgi:hypothetical protein